MQFAIARLDQLNLTFKTIPLGQNLFCSIISSLKLLSRSLESLLIQQRPSNLNFGEATAPFGKDIAQPDVDSS
jgi:hypothetical protein